MFLYLKNFFLDFFAGKSAASECVGFDISDTSVECVAIKADKEHGFKITFKNRITTNAKVVEEGIVKDARALADLMRLVSKGLYTPGRLSRLVVGITDQKIYLHRFSIPKLDTEVTGDYILEEARRVFPIEKTGAVIDYVIVEQGENLHGVMVACEKHVLEGYDAAMRHLGASQAIAEPQSLALIRSVVKGASEPDPLFVIDFGASYVGIYLVERGEVLMSVTLNRAGADVVGTIAEKFKITREEAERRKNKYGFRDSDLVFILQQVPQAIVLEVRKLVVFYEHAYNKNIGKIYLAGGESLTPGIHDYLAANLNKSVLQISTKEDILYSVAIGLALRCFEGGPSLDLFRPKVL